MAVGSKMEGVGAKAMAEVLKTITLIAQSCRKHHLTLELPTFVMLGYQSSGKTFFIEYFTQLPIGFSTIGTGTRCPVRYILIHDDTLVVPKVKVDGTETPHMELPSSLKAHMEELANRGIMSDKELEVEIRSPSVPDFVFVDLPGFVLTTKENTEIIQNLVRKYIESSNVYIVALLKAVESSATNAEYVSLVELIKKVGLQVHEDKVVFVVNKFDGPVRIGVNYDDVLVPPPRRSREPTIDAPRYFYTSMNPMAKKDEEMVKFEDKSNFIAKMEATELAWFNEKVRPEIVARGSERLVDDLFLLSNVKKFLLHKLFQMFSVNKTRLIGKLKAEQRRLTELLGGLESRANQLGEMDDVDGYMQDISRQFIELTHGLLCAKEVNMKAHDGIPVPLLHGTFKPQIFGATAQQDVISIYNVTQKSPFYNEHNAGSEGTGPDWSSFGTFLDMLNSIDEDHHLRCRRFEKPQIGTSAFIRLKLMLEYILISRADMPIDEEEILNNINAKNGRNAVPETVKELVRRSTASCAEGIYWLHAGLETLLESYLDLVYNRVVQSIRIRNAEFKDSATESAEIDFLGDVKKQVLRHFQDTALHDMKTRWEDTLRLLTQAEVKEDAPIKSLLSVVNSGYNFTISQEQHQGSPGTPSSTVPVRDITDRLVNLQIKNREIIGEVGITAADVVEGDYQIIHNPSAARTNPDLVRDQVRVYYLDLLHRLLSDLDMAFDQYFIKKCDKLLAIPDFVWKSLQNDASYQKHREAIKKTKDTLDHNISNTQEGLIAIEEIIRDVDKIPTEDEMTVGTTRRRSGSAMETDAFHECPESEPEPDSTAAA